MIAKISTDGVLSIICESDLEVFAIKQWKNLNVACGRSRDNKMSIYEIGESMLKFCEYGEGRKIK